MDAFKDVSGENKISNFKSGQPAGMVFDIKRFATGDGPGIRTMVFLKGCPMRCMWCANPESHSLEGEILYYKNKCTGCLKCLRMCPEQAIKTDERYGLVTDKDRCSLCGACVENCYSNARELAGKPMTVGEVMKEVVKDRQFYENTGGGVTLSGGEPLVQSEFCVELLRACAAEKIHTAIETCGMAKAEDVKKCLSCLDFIMYDYKHIDSNIHKKYTGCGNEHITENLLMINRCIKTQTLVVRIPFIPGFNGSYDTVHKMLHFLSGLKKISWVEILPYHRLGKLKYDGLGIPYQLDDVEPVKKEDLGQYIAVGKELGLDVRIDAKA